MTDGNCILLFVKYPVPGRVKTRLGHSVGEKTAAELYSMFVLDILSGLAGFDAALRICFDPYEPQMRYQEWLGGDYSYIPQQGNDLGRRMKNAFESAFGCGFSKVVIIGSDSPDLPGDFISLALAKLDSFDAAVGPGSDGGYYLIGFRRESFLPTVFSDIAWSGPSVFEKTKQILETNQRRTYFLGQWHDVDTLGDLEALWLRNRNTPFKQSMTISYLLKTMPEGILYV